MKGEGFNETEKASKEPVFMQLPTIFLSIDYLYLRAAVLRNIRIIKAPFGPGSVFPRL